MPAPMLVRYLALPFAMALASVAAADVVHVRVTGLVESNGFATGALASVPAGAPVVLDLDLDPMNFLDSTSLPGRTRGYAIVGNSLRFSAGSVTVTRNIAFPGYFCLRNNDPRADGFFLSQGTDIDTQIPLNLGLPQAFGVAFSRTFDISTPPPTPDDSLTSLDILDAFGSWGFEDLSVYNFTVELNEVVVPMVIAYERITIAPAPCAGARCAADHNCSGAATVQDLFDFLDHYFVSDPRADFNSSNAVTVQDIFDYLLAYFAGCP